jgi:hypothetical protein
MGTDQLDARFRQPISQGIGVGRSIVDQSWTLFVEDAIVEQRLDLPDVRPLSTIDIAAQRQSLAIDQHEQLGSFAFLGLADRRAPFFAGANVASAIATSQSSLPSRSSFFSNRSQAWAKTPSLTHSFSRRQHVQYEGKRSGKSFHGEPVRRIQMIPSRQGRGATLGRPPVGRSTKRCLIKVHCSSVSSGWGAVLAPVVLRPRLGHHSRESVMPWSPFKRPRLAIRLPFRITNYAL